jgi:protein-disulfide isomerase
MNSKTRRRFVLTVVAIALLGIALIFFFRGRTTSNIPKKAINYAGMPISGSTESPNKILAIEDLKCYGCKMYNNLVYPQLKKELIDTGKASYHVLLVSFLHGSEPAANTAYCLKEQNPDYFFQFLHYVYGNQPPESTNWATPATLIQMAERATDGADLTRLSQCMLANRYSKQLKDNLAYAAKLMNNELTTPTILVNGKLLKHPTAAKVKKQLKED